jgi:hypothetical protein
VARGGSRKGMKHLSLYSLDDILSCTIKVASGCWEWQRGCFTSGYGQVRFLGEKWRVHRLVWTLIDGTIPKDLMVLHNCANPRCIRPDHLKLGTHQDNMIDRDLHGHTVRGERVHTSKLTEKDILTIRSCSTLQEAYSSLTEIKINIDAIKMVYQRKTWKHVDS